MAANQAKRLVVSTFVTRCYCSSTSAVVATIASKGKEVPLSRKLLAIVGPNEAAVADTLDDWVKRGQSVKRHDIMICINRLRKSNKYRHALQLHEWMEKREIQMNNADRAIHIDLLAKTHGVGSAEDYFNSLQESEKSRRTYGALLSCFCKEKMTDKATELFEKMKDLSFNSTLNYNNMMFLYLSIDEPQKVPLLDKEMEDLNVAADTYTYNLLINSYASMKKFDAVDGVLDKMRVNNVIPDWFTLENVATVYVNAGLTNKATDFLKNLENMNKISYNRVGLQNLITLYGRMNDPEGATRAWEALDKPTNMSYLVMLLALLKLKDVDGLAKRFTEWESNCSFYDVRLANVMLESYFNRNMIDEANALYESVITRGTQPNLRTLDLFTNYYLKNRKVDLALKFLEMGASKVSPTRGNWFPNEETVSMFVKLIEEDKVEERVEKFYGIMKQIGRFDSVQKFKEV